MQPERRKHRTPFLSEEAWLRDSAGQMVAYCANSGAAHFLKVAANSFDDLTEALRLCRGEFELSEEVQNHPGWQRIKALSDRIENELRNGG